MKTDKVLFTEKKGKELCPLEKCLKEYDKNGKPIFSVQYWREDGKQVFCHKCKYKRMKLKKKTLKKILKLCKKYDNECGVYPESTYEGKAFFDFVIGTIYNPGANYIIKLKKEADRFYEEKRKENWEIDQDEQYKK